ncbi:MAG: UvrB/UvrC motif-containing protein [Pirellulales bacterium]|nr:UvrB/UvrC motif-containing protein [Pirellulales bacterium]
MDDAQDIDRLLRSWPMEPGKVLARVIETTDGRQVVQMRVEMGVLQMETSGRPDGERPGGAETYFEHLRDYAKTAGDDFVLTEEQCEEADREFVQYYHRRICWLAMRQFDRAAQDALHTLRFMDFVRDYSPDEQWTITHEQYRPFVMFHHIQASSLAALSGSDPETAIEEANRGISQFESLLEGSEIPTDEHELVKRLVDLREWIREKYDVGLTLVEQLTDAIASEKYELAASLRDQIARREDGGM